APLTPLAARRTVYGRVSRYKLDDFLQLFDFPSPNLSAEKRFTTRVPLQRLFFMNSDFVQQQAELLAQRVANETDNAARIRKAYRLVFGRTPSDAELKAGLTFITSEPLKDFEERKKAKDTKDAKDAKPSTDPASSDDPKASTDDDKREKSDIASDGMMAGVVPGVAKTKADEPKLLAVRPWGRYMKVLRISNKFFFVN